MESQSNPLRLSDLYKLVSDLLDLEVTNGGRTYAGGHRVVSAVFKAIKEGLARGEDVTIESFGTFSTRKLPAYTHVGAASHFGETRRKGRFTSSGQQVLYEIPERWEVYFRPSAVVTAPLNRDLEQFSAKERSYISDIRKRICPRTPRHRKNAS